MKPPPQVFEQIELRGLHPQPPPNIEIQASAAGGELDLRSVVSESKENMGCHG